MTSHLNSIDGRYWRMLRADAAATSLEPARAPEGRSHYDGQPALYLSETPEGCTIATARYLRPDDPPRALFPLHVTSTRIIDLRDAAATEHHGIDVTHRAAQWQDIRATGASSPTWAISDAVREKGFHGMLYASRSVPHLTHLTLFRWNTTDGATVRPDGPSRPAPPA